MLAMEPRFGAALGSLHTVQQAAAESPERLARSRRHMLSSLRPLTSITDWAWLQERPHIKIQKNQDTSSTGATLLPYVPGSPPVAVIYLVFLSYRGGLLGMAGRVVGHNRYACRGAKRLMKQ